jgi:hypothetical protein
MSFSEFGTGWLHTRDRLTSRPMQRSHFNGLSFDITHPLTLNCLIAPSTASALLIGPSSSLSTPLELLAPKTRLSGPVTVCPLACAKPADRSCAGFGE